MNNRSVHILLVDDDLDFVNDFHILLPQHMKYTAASSVAEAYRHLSTAEPDVVFLDIDLGAGGDGMAFLGQLKQEWPYLPVIMISGNQDIGMVVAAMRAGASGYVGKNPDLDRLKLSIERAIAENQLRQRYDFLESEIGRLQGELVGNSSIMQDIRQQMRRLAGVTSTVLITGESGTGKELVARGIHRLSDQREQPFVAVNCAALSRELIESELFGHERGAFTGAIGRHIGKFELAGTGTLFLDEITEIPVHVQAKLLRVLQEREFERVGGSHLIPFRGRILASSNRDIKREVAEQRLREDLLYRINVTMIHLPPLAEHREDIPTLAEYFLGRKAREMKKGSLSIHPDAMALLYSYQWPGNIRELGNCIENAVVHAIKNVLEPADFSRVFAVQRLEGTYEEAKRRNEQQFQHDYLVTVLSKAGSNISQAAREMGISRQGLIKMMKRCGLD